MLREMTLKEKRIIVRYLQSYQSLGEMISRDFLQTCTEVCLRLYYAVQRYKYHPTTGNQACVLLCAFVHIKGAVHANYKKTYFLANLQQYLSHADGFGFILSGFEISVFCLHSNIMEVIGILLGALKAIKMPHYKSSTAESLFIIIVTLEVLCPKEIVQINNP